MRSDKEVLEAEMKAGADEFTARAIVRLERELAGGIWRFVLIRILLAPLYWLLYAAAIVIHDPAMARMGIATGVGASFGSVISSFLAWKQLPKQLDDYRSGRVRAPNRDASEGCTLWGVGFLAILICSYFHPDNVRNMAFAVMLTITCLVLMGWGALKYAQAVLATDPSCRDKHTNCYLAILLYVIVVLCSLYCIVLWYEACY